MPTRQELIQKVRDGWPEHAANTETDRRGIVHVPPVRDGGLSALVIEFAVDTVLAELEASK